MNERRNARRRRRRRRRSDTGTKHYVSRSTQPVDETPEKGAAETIQDQLKAQVHKLITEGGGKSMFQKGKVAQKLDSAEATPMQNKYEKGDKQCKEAVEKGDHCFSWRSALGQRLQREIKGNPKTRKSYLSCADKDEWKRDWCKKQYKGAISRMRTYSTAVSEEWMSKGKLVSFLRMCYEEGGPRGQWDPETIEDCSVIATRCIQLGYPFAQADEQHGKVKFMWFSHQYSDKFQKKWEESELQHEKKDGGNKQKAIKTGDADGADGAAAESGDDAPDEADPNKTDPAVPPVKKEKAPVAVALAHARKVIVSIQSTLASARSLCEDIAEKTDEGGDDADVEWAWARTPIVQGKIDAAIKEIEGIVKKNKLWQKLLIGVDTSKVRRRRRR